MDTKLKVFRGSSREVEKMAKDYANEKNLYIISTSISSHVIGYHVECVMSVIYGRNKVHEH